MKNLFVGNLSFQTTEGELTDLFKGFGQVTRVHVAMDRETGRARGFAFVEMPNDEEAAKAIAGPEWKRGRGPRSEGERSTSQDRAERTTSRQRWRGRARTGRIFQRGLQRSPAQTARTSLVIPHEAAEASPAYIWI